VGFYPRKWRLSPIRRSKFLECELFPAFSGIDLKMWDTEQVFCALVGLDFRLESVREAATGGLERHCESEDYGRRIIDRFRRSIWSGKAVWRGT
jgi:hypothetical protein